MTMRYITIILVCLGSLRALAEQSVLTPADLLEAEQARYLSRYQCADGQRCTVQCAAGDGQVSLDKSGVRRVELALSDTHRILTVVFVDAVGKAHRSQALLPMPASCVFDNLTLLDTLSVSGGVVDLPARGSQEVIFDVVPGSD